MASACALIMANEQMMLRPMARLRSRASTCVIVSVAVVCVCTLVVCGVMVAREYSLATSYEMTSSCRLANITQDRYLQCLYCSNSKAKTNEKGTAANSCFPTQFPCVQIGVTFHVGGSEYNALLHPDSLQATGQHSQCSFSVCLKNKEDNERAVSHFVDRWRNHGNRTFDCYYDVETWDNVIIEKKYTRNDVIHSMLWPSVVLVTCAGVFLYLETRRRGLTFCGRKDGLRSGEAKTIDVDISGLHSGCGSLNDVLKGSTGGLGEAANNHHRGPAGVSPAGAYQSVMETTRPNRYTPAGVGAGHGGGGGVRAVVAASGSHYHHRGANNQTQNSSQSAISKSMTSLDRINNKPHDPHLATETAMTASGSNEAPARPLVTAPGELIDARRHHRLNCKSESVDRLRDIRVSTNNVGGSPRDITSLVSRQP